MPANDLTSLTSYDSSNNARKRLERRGVKSGREYCCKICRNTVKQGRSWLTRCRGTSLALIGMLRHVLRYRPNPGFPNDKASSAGVKPALFGASRLAPAFIHEATRVRPSTTERLLQNRSARPSTNSGEQQRWKRPDKISGCCFEACQEKAFTTRRGSASTCRGAQNKKSPRDDLQSPPSLHHAACMSESPSPSFP